MAEKSARRSARGLARISVADMQRELRRRQKLVIGLGRKRDKLMARLAELERRIAECGGSVNGSRGRGGAGAPRGGRSSTLAGALAALLKGRSMSVTAMSEAVQQAGYRTDSPNFRTIVNAALIKHTDLFRRVGRGMYTAT